MIINYKYFETYYKLLKVFTNETNYANVNILKTTYYTLPLAADVL